jgi:hypothetical protein
MFLLARLVRLYLPVKTIELFRKDAKMGNENKTIKQIIAEVKEMTADNAHGHARELLAELAGHKNKGLLKVVNLAQIEIGHMPPALITLRDKLFAPVMESLEIQFPDYIEEIKKAL